MLPDKCTGSSCWSKCVEERNGSTGQETSQQKLAHQPGAPREGIGDNSGASREGIDNNSGAPREGIENNSGALRVGILDRSGAPMEMYWEKL